MRVDPTLVEFLDNPNTMDFITRQNEYLVSYFKDNPNIVWTQVLMGGYVIGYLNRKYNEELEKNMGSSYANAVPLVCGLLDSESLDAAGISQVQRQPYLHLTGRGVLIGFVDTGIDYTKDIFKYENGASKIQYIYDQTVRGNTPEGFYFGTEYSNAQINEALKAQNPYDIVPQKDMAGHGTFLASIAAGRETAQGFTGAAPDAELVVVKLRKARQFYLDFLLVPPEQENAFEYSDIMIGIDYILKKARELGRPVVICLALGTNLGSHDGYSIFEEYLSGISLLRGVCVCVAAGNESQAKHHVQGMITSAGQDQSIDIRVGENAGDFIISLWNTLADRLSVSIKSPTGEVVGRLPAVVGKRYEGNFLLEKTRAEVGYFFPIEGSGDQLTVIWIYNATPGIWSVIIHGDIVSNGAYHAWLPTTGLVSPAVVFLAPSSNVTVVVPATADSVISCGAYDSKTDSLYFNSSWGPTRAMNLKPDLVAPGVDVGGVYPTGSGVMTGTSVSTAITVGASALLLQWGIVNGNNTSMSTYHVKAYLVRGCSRGSVLVYPNQQWGYGSLNLMETFSLMREV